MKVRISIVTALLALVVVGVALAESYMTFSGRAWTQGRPGDIEAWHDGPGVSGHGWTNLNIDVGRDALDCRPRWRMSESEQSSGRCPGWRARGLLFAPRALAR
jgi:hypothetical protein